MNHTVELSPNARAKCRGCGEKLTKGELRLGERMPNPFGGEDDIMTHWYHPSCAAYKRPEAFLEAENESGETIDEYDTLAEAAKRGMESERVARIDGAQVDPSGRAACRHCHEKIEKESWRLKLVYYEEGRFNPGGFLHPGCANAYFETKNIMDRVKHFSPDLSPDEISQVATEIS